MELQGSFADTQDCIRSTHTSRYNAVMVCGYIELLCWDKDTFAKIQYCFADIWGSFTDIKGSFADIKCSFADIKGSFADIKGSFADTQDCIRSTHTSRRNAMMVCGYIELLCWDKITPVNTY